MYRHPRLPITWYSESRDTTRVQHPLPYVELHQSCSIRSILPFSVVLLRYFLAILTTAQLVIQVSGSGPANDGRLRLHSTRLNCPFFRRLISKLREPCPLSCSIQLRTIPYVGNFIQLILSRTAEPSPLQASPDAKHLAHRLLLHLLAPTAPCPHVPAEP